MAQEILKVCRISIRIALETYMCCKACSAYKLTSVQQSGSASYHNPCVKNWKSHGISLVDYVLGGKKYYSSWMDTSLTG